MSFDTLLGAAYKTATLDNQREVAITALRDRFNESAEDKAAAEAFIAENTGSKVKDEVSQRCFITRLRLDLLKAALA